MSRPAWALQAEAALKEVAQRDSAQKRAKALALVNIAARRRDPLGRFLRSKLAKRYNEAGRCVQRFSCPLALADLVFAEAGDVKLSFSRMAAVLAALGLPVWRELKERFLTGDYDESVMPELVRSIMQNAINPIAPKTERSRVAWRNRVESALQAAQPKRRKYVDPTAAVLAGLGGGKLK